MIEIVLGVLSIVRLLGILLRKGHRRTRGNLVLEEAIRQEVFAVGPVASASSFPSVGGGELREEQECFVGCVAFGQEPILNRREDREGEAVDDFKVPLEEQQRPGAVEDGAVDGESVDVDKESLEPGGRKEVEVEPVISEAVGDKRAPGVQKEPKFPAPSF